MPESQLSLNAHSRLRKPLQPLTKIDPLTLVKNSNQNQVTMAWMAAIGAAAGAAGATLLAHFISSVNLDKWRFERDHKGRSEFVKV
jgi:hypothetical protein